MPGVEERDVRRRNEVGPDDLSLWVGVKGPGLGCPAIMLQLLQQGDQRS